MDIEISRACRDAMIGAASRMMGCAGRIKINVGKGFLKEDLFAALLVVSDLGDVVNAIVKLAPELSLNDQQWRAIEIAEARDSSLELADLLPKTLVDVGAVEDRMLRVAALAPELDQPISTAMQNLAAFAARICAKLQRRDV